MSPTKIDVRIENQKVWVGETAIPLMGGEVHYWRLDPKAWRSVLEKVKALGIKVVATYVCWDFHEITPGQFDFRGESDPRRNLTGFLDLLAEMGFWIIIRPGPYIYSEWPNAGVPEYAARYHRLDPAYLPLARRYLESVLPLLKPYFASNGGRIILCQAENEPDCWPHMYTEALGLGTQPGLFQEFLEERYGAIEKLNQTWQSDYQTFKAARAILSLPPGRLDLTPRYLDYYRFKHWYVARAVQWTVDTFRELGVDIPIYTNTIASHSNEPWAEMERIAGLNGTDLYPSNGFRKPEEHRKFLQDVRYLRSYSKLPYIAEFEAGVWHGAHVENENGALLPRHYRMAATSALLAGATGWNWYMLVNRDNWYMAPINERGLARTDLYAAFKQVVELYDQLDPASLEKVSDIAVTIDPLQQAAAHAESDLLRALYQADIDYEFFDTNTGQRSQSLLFYAGDAWLDAGGQQRLVSYMEGGGRLVCIGSAPRLDDTQRPLNRLEIPEPSGVIGDMGGIALDLYLGEHPLTIKTGWMEHFDHVPGQPLVVTRRSVDEDAVEEMQFLCNLPTGDRYTVGFTRPWGKGQLIYLGLQPSPELLPGLCTALGAPPPVRSVTPGVSTALFQRKGQPNLSYIIVVNTGSEYKAAEVTFRPRLPFAGPATFRDMGSGRIFHFQPGGEFFLPISGKDGAVLAIQPQ